jgi:hypothetical protein
MHAAGQREYLAVRDEWENDEIGAGRDEPTGMSNRNTQARFWGELVSSEPESGESCIAMKNANLTPEIYEKM